MAAGMTRSRVSLAELGDVVVEDLRGHRVASTAARVRASQSAMVADLIAFARLIAAYLATPLGAALAQTMAVAEDEPELADGRAAFWRTRYNAAQVMIDRAIERNELAAGTDSQLALELLVAPLHFRALLVRQPIDDSLIEQLVDTLLRGLAKRIERRKGVLR
jgi:Tetracyclin repressor-like, C-terminal domain